MGSSPTPKAPLTSANHVPVTVPTVTGVCVWAEVPLLSRTVSVTGTGNVLVLAKVCVVVAPLPAGDPSPNVHE
jgi:hypothetical protein